MTGPTNGQTAAPIAFAKPMVSEEEARAVLEVLESGTFVHGSTTHTFEAQFADRIGTRYAISVSSCTAALHLCLFAGGVAAGDVVAVPAMTHVATAHAVEYCGARPIFVDSDPTTGNMDIDALEEAAGDVLAAIMVVHYLGLPVEMGRVLDIAASAGAFVLEDCALAVDATYEGRKVGTFGRAGCFSFYPTKHLTSVEGGMVTTDDEALAAAITSRRAFGYDKPLGQRPRPGIYDVTELGYNYRMSEIEAAVGLAQLAKLDAFQAARETNFAALSSALADVDELTVFPSSLGAAKSSHFCLNAVLPKDGRIDRDTVAADLRANGIGTSVHYPKAVPLTTFYREKYGYRDGQFPVAEWIASQALSLPVGPHLADGDPDRIALAVKDAIFKASHAGSGQG
jgi:perosamine synthetase